MDDCHLPCLDAIRRLANCLGERDGASYYFHANSPDGTYSPPSKFRANMDIVLKKADDTTRIIAGAAYDEAFERAAEIT